MSPFRKASLFFDGKEFLTWAALGLKPVASSPAPLLRNGVANDRTWVRWKERKMQEICCAAEKYSFVDSEFLCPIRSMLNQPYSCLLLLLDQKRVIYSYSGHSWQKTYFYRMKNYFLRVSGPVPPRDFWQFGNVKIVFFLHLDIHDIDHQPET